MKKEEVKEEVFQFLKALRKCFNPYSYRELSQRRFFSAFSFFASFLLIIGTFVFIMMIPSLFSIQDNFLVQIDKFDKLSIAPDYVLSEEILIPSDNPIISIDSNESSAYIQISKSGLKLDHGIFQTEFQSLDDIKSNAKFFSELFFMLFLMFLPGFVMFSFLYFLVKYLVIIWIFSTFIHFLLVAFKNRIRYKYSFVSGLYLSPLLLILGLINFYFNLYYLHYLVYGLYLAFILTKISHKRY